MGLRGPAPRPTVLTKMLGNPGHQTFNKNEPRPVKVKPTPPDWLSGEALAEWDRISDDLYDIGLLTRVDRTSLTAYCQAYARWVECEQAINEHGVTFIGRLGIQIRPEATMAAKLYGIIKTFCHEFGLSPSARARMVLPDQGGDEDDDGLD